MEEIADTVAFLVNPRASDITGANLRPDDGMWPGLYGGSEKRVTRVLVPLAARAPPPTLMRGGSIRHG
ncbi:hypothetical protein [Phyllobacterium phragmitis]|uniref:hypothetical protein n=1 Tax=Phyllobacterium phragmitis TaxID=2670329 RepID=UPI00315A0A27